MYWWIEANGIANHVVEEHETRATYTRWNWLRPVNHTRQLTADSGVSKLNGAKTGSAQLTVIPVSRAVPTTNQPAHWGVQGVSSQNQHSYPGYTYSDQLLRTINHTLGQGVRVNSLRMFLLYQEKIYIRPWPIRNYLSSRLDHLDHPLH